MTCLSDKEKNAVEQLKKTFYNYDLQIVRAEYEIKLRNEIINLYQNSTNKKELSFVAVALVEKENYQVFKNKLNEHKKSLTDKIRLVSEKYNGVYSDIFMDFFFKGLTIEEIAEKTGYKTYYVEKAIFKLKQDLFTYVI